MWQSAQGHAGDRAAAIANTGAIRRIDIGTGGPFAPADNDDDAGIASALAAASRAPETPRVLPMSAVQRAANFASTSRSVAAYFEQLATAEGHFASPSITADAADDLDELLESLAGSLPGT